MLIPAILFNRPFPSCPKPLFQSEAKCEAIDVKNIFYSHANKQERWCTQPLFGLLSFVRAHFCRIFYFLPRLTTPQVYEIPLKRGRQSLTKVISLEFLLRIWHHIYVKQIGLIFTFVKLASQKRNLFLGLFVKPFFCLFGVSK